MLRLALYVLLLCGGPAAAQAAQTPAQPTGRWITADNQAVIQISPCGAELCGQIVGLALAHPGDKMPMDWRGAPQCGMTILETAPTTNATGATSWVGEVLDPRDGTVYHASMMLDAFRHLLLHGYVGLPVFGQTQTWMPYNGRTLANCRLAGAVPPAAGTNG